MDNFERLKELVAKQRWEYDFPLTRDTTLQKDLKMWGDDAFEFIDAFGKEFGIDLSEFDIKKYFRPEGDVILPAIIGAILFRKKKKYLPLTLGDLEKAIEKGKLI
jgi:hypothetical protein